MLSKDQIFECLGDLISVCEKSTDTSIKQNRKIKFARLVIDEELTFKKDRETIMDNFEHRQTISRKKLPDFLDDIVNLCEGSTDKKLRHHKSLETIRLIIKSEKLFYKLA